MTDAPLFGATSVGEGGGVGAAEFTAVTAATQPAMRMDRIVIEVDRVSGRDGRCSCIGTISGSLPGCVPLPPQQRGSQCCDRSRLRASENTHRSSRRIDGVGMLACSLAGASVALLAQVAI